LRRIVKRLFSKGLAALMIPNLVGYTRFALDVRRTSSDSAISTESPWPRRSLPDLSGAGKA